MVVSGNPGGPLAVAGALAAGPVVGAGVLVLSQVFKGQLKGLTRAYYRDHRAVGGPGGGTHLGAAADRARQQQEAAAAQLLQ